MAHKGLCTCFGMYFIMLSDIKYFLFLLRFFLVTRANATHELFLSNFQVDLRHIDEVKGQPEVEIGVDLSEFYMSVEWDILEVPAVRNVKWYTCCTEPYLDITFNVTMRRKTLFYTVNLIIPCMGISFLTVLVFYLPSDSGEKVSSHKLYNQALVGVSLLSNTIQTIMRASFQ